MIIKFDHLAYSCNSTELTKVESTFKGYKIGFRDEVVNLPLKENLMHRYNDTHILTFLEPLSPEVIPIEITSYNTVADKQTPSIEYDTKHTIKIYTENINNTTSLLKAVGFKNKDNHLEYTSLFAPKTVLVKLIETKHNINWALDNSGFSCLAFMSNNALKEQERLSEQFECTEVDKLVVNDKNLSLFFVKGSSGELIEIFSVDRK